MKKIILLSIFLIFFINFCSAITLNNLTINTTQELCNDSINKIDIFPLNLTNNFTSVDIVKLSFSNTNYSILSLFENTDRYTSYFTLTNSSDKINLTVYVKQKEKEIELTKEYKVVKCKNSLVSSLKSLNTYIKANWERVKNKMLDMMLSERAIITLIIIIAVLLLFLFLNFVKKIKKLKN